MSLSVKILEAFPRRDVPMAPEFVASVGIRKILKKSFSKFFFPSPSVLTGCGDTTDQSVAYFESPNYPHPFRESMICVLIVNIRKNVQQLRLDFLMFEVGIEMLFCRS